MGLLERANARKSMALPSLGKRRSMTSEHDVLTFGPSQGGPSRTGSSESLLSLATIGEAQHMPNSGLSRHGVASRESSNSFPGQEAPRTRRSLSQGPQGVSHS